MRDARFFNFRRLFGFTVLSLWVAATAATAQEIPETISFASGGAALSAQAKAALEQVAAWMNANPDKRLQIQGHTDQRGSQEENMAMGERRAGTVKTFLIGLGIDADRMDTVSFGEEAPLDPANTSEARARNRRCTLVVLTP